MRNKSAPALGLAGLLALAAPAYAEVPPASAEHVSYAARDKLPDWRGIWTPMAGGPRSGAGEAPVFKGKYLAIYENTQRRIRAGEDVKPELTSNCTPPGMPGIMQLGQYPYEFLFTPGRVTINQEAWMQTRTIWTDGRRHQPDADPTYMGDSIGHWEGDALVADTVAIKDTVPLGPGMTHSDKIHITERIHLKPGDPDTLINEITVEDPDALAEPWHTTATYHRDRYGQLLEFECAENDRNPVDEKGDTTFQ